MFISLFCYMFYTNNKLMTITLCFENKSSFGVEPSNKNVNTKQIDVLNIL